MEIFQKPGTDKTHFAGSGPLPRLPRSCAYDAELEYDRYDGYELTFFDKDKNRIEWPKWAEDYDNGYRDILSDLDRMSDESEQA